MAMEDLSTGLDLYDYVMSFGNQPGGPNDDYASQVKTAIRATYWDFLQLHPWWFARAGRPFALAIAAKQSVTVQSIAGATVTLSASIATSQVNKKLAINANNVPYVIIAHTAGTALLTLDAAYVETPASGAATIFQDEYVCPATCLKPWGPLKSRGPFERLVDILLEREWKARYDWKILSGIGPIEAAYVVRGQIDPATGLIAPVLRVAPWTDTAMVLEGEYTEFHDVDFSGAVATDSPKLPRPDRWVLAERALFTLWRNKNNTLADSAELKAAKKQAEMEMYHLSMASRESLYVRSAHSVGAR